jgi:hypothetical protein
MILTSLRAACGAALCLAAALAAPTVRADSGIGLSFGEVTLTAAQDGETIAAAAVLGDFATGPGRGVQVALDLRSIGGDALLQADLHAYLNPAPGAKYGLFASLADVGRREATVGMVGAAGVWQLGSRTTLELLGGAGLATHDPGGGRRNLDFLHAAATLRQGLGDHLEGFVRAGVTDVSEAFLDTRIASAEIGLDWRPGVGAVTLTAAIGRDRLAGRDSAPGETLARLGVTWRFGGGGGGGVAGRALPRPAPLDPLIRRGLF